MHLFFTLNFIQLLLLPHQLLHPVELHVPLPLAQHQLHQPLCYPLPNHDLILHLRIRRFLDLILSKVSFLLNRRILDI